MVSTPKDQITKRHTFSGDIGRRRLPFSASEKRARKIKTSDKSVKRMFKKFRSDPRFGNFSDERLLHIIRRSIGIETRGGGIPSPSSSVPGIRKRLMLKELEK